MNTDSILDRVARERARQEELRRSGKFPWTCASQGPTHAEKLAVLVEEVGEVGREIVEQIIERSKYAGEPLEYPPHRVRARDAHLLEELIQVAAVAVAWAEAVSERLEGEGR